MISKVYSCTLQGLEGQTIEVEADISPGLPAFNIVGLAGITVQEAKERTRSSIKNSGADFPLQRKTLNLAPALLPKQGTLLDLPIAISILLASKQIPITIFEDALIVGELSLDGQLRRIPGALAIAHHAKTQKFKRLFIPQENLIEASHIRGVEIVALDHLKDLIQLANFPNKLTKYQQKVEQKLKNASNSQFSQQQNLKHQIEDLIGLEKEKRALCIAAAGGHNLLFTGAPGNGKTALSLAMPSILPAFSERELLESSKIHSVAGKLTADSLLTSRPFRQVHHSSTQIALLGGGTKIQPGEISLAHNGVLFLDEICEFPRANLEALRQPLEDGVINISRARNSYILPANFTLIATRNPCPCGFYGTKKAQKCHCTLHSIESYQSKLSGPLLDRFDLFINVEATDFKYSHSQSPSSKELRQKVETAFQIQTRRYKNHSQFQKNSDLNFSGIQKFCQLDPAAKKLLDQAQKNLQLSNRAYLRILKLARTIADLETCNNILIQHLTESIHYRSLTNKGEK